MGGFRAGPLIFAVFRVAPISLLSSPPLTTLPCESFLNPLAFQVSTFTQNTLLPNGMMAIRYPETEQEDSPHVSVHRVLMVIPGLQEWVC